MAESVDALVSNTSGATHPGSSPGLGTRLKRKRMCRHILFFLLMQRYCSHPQLSIIHYPLGRQAIQLCTNTVELIAVRIVITTWIIAFHVSFLIIPSFFNLYTETQRRRVRSVYLPQIEFTADYVLFIYRRLRRFHRFLSWLCVAQL